MKFIVSTQVKYHLKSRHDLSALPRRGPTRRLREVLKATKGRPADAEPMAGERWLFGFEGMVVTYVIKDVAIVRWLPFVVIRNVIIVHVFTVRRAN